MIVLNRFLSIFIQNNRIELWKLVSRISLKIDWILIDSNSFQSMFLAGIGSVLTPGHKNLRSAPPKLHHRPPGIPRSRIQSVLTPGHKNLRSAPPRLIIGHLEHLDHAFVLFRHLDTKTYGTHHLDSIIGHLGHLDLAYDLFWHLDAKTYGAHHLYSIIGHLEHLDRVVDLFWQLDTKIYGAQYLDFIIGHQVHLDVISNLFWQLDT